MDRLLQALLSSLSLHSGFSAVFESHLENQSAVSKIDCYSAHALSVLMVSDRESFELKIGDRKQDCDDYPECCGNVVREDMEHVDEVATLRRVSVVAERHNILDLVLEDNFHVGKVTAQGDSHKVI